MALALINLQLLMERRSFVILNAHISNVQDSHGYTGKGSASYPNGDQFKGDFVDGVSLSFKSITLLNRNGMVKESTSTMSDLKTTQTMESTLASGLIISDMVSVNKPIQELVSITDIGRKASVTVKVLCHMTIKIYTLVTGVRVKKTVKAPILLQRLTKSTWAPS